MLSDCHASTRAIRTAVTGREPEVLYALKPPGAIAGPGACHWRWWLEVVE
jgi:hypothetical protein